MRSTDTIEYTGNFHSPSGVTAHKLAAVEKKTKTMEWWHTALRLCGTYERVTLGYLAVSSSLLVVFRNNLPNAGEFFLLHSAIGAGILTLVWAAERWPTAGMRFARYWYPFAMFIFFFEELHHIVHLIFPGWFDHWLIAFDFALFRAHPTVWMEQFAAPAMNDVMAFFYLTYYFFTVVLGGVLYARKEWKNFWMVMTATALAYTIGYLIALAFPVEGPYHTLRALQQGPLEGGPMTALMGAIQRFGRVHGAAFPSLHVAGSFVALLCARKFERRIFWIFLPLFAAMCVSTVYGRYHYVADIFGGLIVGAMGYVIVQSWLLKRGLRGAAS